MSLPIVRESADVVRIFDPSTGIEVDLANDAAEVLAVVRDAIKEAEDTQRIAKQELDAELHRRMDRANTLTLHLDGWEIKGKPETKAEWDPDALAVVLGELVEAGELTESAAREALKPTIVLKPMAGKLKKLGERFPDVAGCCEQVLQTRYASVKRSA